MYYLLRELSYQQTIETRFLILKAAT